MIVIVSLIQRPNKCLHMLCHHAAGRRTHGASVTLVLERIDAPPDGALHGPTDVDCLNEGAPALRVAHSRHSSHALRSGLLSAC